MGGPTPAKDPFFLGAAGVPPHSPTLRSCPWLGRETLPRRLRFTHRLSPLSLPQHQLSQRFEQTLLSHSHLRGGEREKGRANPGKSRQSCFKIKCILFFFYFFFSPFLIHSSKLAKIKCAIYLRRVGILKGTANCVIVLLIFIPRHRMLTD